MQSTVAPESVIRFLNHFEDVAMKEDFSLLEDMIDERAYFRFNDGDFVGRPAIRAVFEKTWKGDPTVKKARFYLSDIVVLTTDMASATATLHVQLGRLPRQSRVQDPRPGYACARARRRQVPNHS